MILCGRVLISLTMAQFLSIPSLVFFISGQQSAIGRRKRPRLILCAIPTGKGQGEGRVRNIAAANVEQPGDRIRQGQNGRIAARFFQVFTDPIALVKAVAQAAR